SSGALGGLLRALRSLDGDHFAGAPCRLDLLLRAVAEAVGLDGQLLGELAAGEDLDRVAPLGQALLTEGLRRHLGVRPAARVEVSEVDRLRPRPELLEGHRHLLVGPAQLAHPHVDRVLAALVRDVALVARAGTGAFVATTGRLPVASPGAAAEPLARTARAGGGLQGVEADLLDRHDGWLLRSAPLPARIPSTSTRCSTLRIMPRSCGLSASLDSAPIRPSFSERSVARCVAEALLEERTCLRATSAIRSPQKSFAEPQLRHQQKRPRRNQKTPPRLRQRSRQDPRRLPRLRALQPPWQLPPSARRPWPLPAWAHRPWQLPAWARRPRRPRQPRYPRRAPRAPRCRAASPRPRASAGCRGPPSWP